MKRWLFFAYGVASHLLFLAVYAYMAGFVGNFLVPKSIDVPGDNLTFGAVTVNLLLLALFAIQHSVMARPAFKRAWTRIVPPPIERATYVVVANIVTIILMWQWRGIDTVVWDIQNPTLRTIAWALFAVGWLMVPAVSFLINHFDLFGTRQVWLYFRGKEYTSPQFHTPILYNRVRHPLYLGWMTAFWATPTMTVGHLLFAGVLTGYMMGAALIEERDLVAHFGRKYQDYQRQVPMFVPRFASVAEPIPQSADESAVVEY